MKKSKFWEKIEILKKNHQKSKCLSSSKLWKKIEILVKNRKLRYFELCKSSPKYASKSVSPSSPSVYSERTSEEQNSQADEDDFDLDVIYPFNDKIQIRVSTQFFIRLF